MDVHRVIIAWHNIYLSEIFMNIKEDASCKGCVTFYFRANAKGIINVEQMSNVCGEHVQNMFNTC